MKKISVALIAFAIILFSASCNKMLNKHHEENEIKETLYVEGTVRVGGTYTYTVPANQSDDPYQITVQAIKYLTSELSTDASGNLIYTFQPVAGALPSTNSYTEDITIENVEEVHTGGNCGNGVASHGEAHHGHHEETEVERTIHIHLTIDGGSLDGTSSKFSSK